MDFQRRSEASVEKKRGSFAWENRPVGWVGVRLVCNKAGNAAQARTFVCVQKRGKGRCRSLTIHEMRGRAT